MPKLTDSVPKYRRHRATDQAVVTITRRDIYLGPFGSKASKIEYDRLIGEWLAAGRPARFAAASEITMIELCALYWRHASGYYSHGGLLGTIKRLLRTLKTTYGRTLAADFGPLSLKAIREQFVREGLSRKYCNKVSNLIRHVFKWAASEQLIPAATWQALTTVSGLRYGHTDAAEHEPVAPIDDAIVDATIPHLSNVIAAMVRLQRLTGMRPAEVCNLRPEEVGRANDVCTYRPSHHKTAHHGRSRVVFIGPRGQEVLRPFLLRDAKAYCFVPAEAVASSRQQGHKRRLTPLNYGNAPGSNRKRRAKRTPGQWYDVHAYRRAINRGCDLAFPAPEDDSPEQIQAWKAKHRWSPNRLRHTAGTEIRKRFGLEGAQVTLGHSKADVTQVYAERDMKKAEDIMRQVG